MKCLLLLAMLVFCIYNNGALADKDHVIYGWVKHGHCPGTLIPDAVDSTYLFGPSLLMLVVVEKTSRVIEDIIWLKNRDEKNPHLARPYPHHENNVTYEMTSRKPENMPFPLKSHQELHMVLYVQTPLDDKMAGYDNQIYYGLSGGLPLNRKNRPLAKLKDESVRLGEIKLYHKVKGRKDQLVFHMKEPDCNALDSHAWIANHGIYHLQKRANGAPYYRNLYYWPRIGKLFT